MRMIQAILIDPFARAVSAVELDGDEYKAIYPLLSHPGITVDTFDVGMCLPNADMVYVDDEGLFDWQARGQQFFVIRYRVGGEIETSQPLAGKGLVMGCDEVGNSVSAVTTLAKVREIVWFLDWDELSGEAGE